MIHFENLTIEEVLVEKEGQLFEQKSARIDPRDLASHFIAFANADGGFIVIGIEDDNTITGLNGYESKINSFLQAAWNLCVLPVRITHQYVKCTNSKNYADRVLLIEIPQTGKLHTNTKDEVYLRISDHSRKLTFDERVQLSYDRGDLSWESVLVKEFPLEDLDVDTLERYRATMGTSLTSRQLLLSRRLAEK
ncbi:MAG: ATP-binding protein [bacterium]|nr:MAG: ATP-binding protein [bacterium]